MRVKIIIAMFAFVCGLNARESLRAFIRGPSEQNEMGMFENYPKDTFEVHKDPLTGFNLVDRFSNIEMKNMGPQVNIHVNTPTKLSEPTEADRKEFYVPDERDYKFRNMERNEPTYRYPRIRRAVEIVGDTASESASDAWSFITRKATEYASGLLSFTVRKTKDSESGFLRRARYYAEVGLEMLNQD